MKEVLINNFPALREIKIEGNILSIKVSVPEQTNPKEKIIRINTFDVKGHLSSIGYEVGECLQSAIVGDDSKNILTGTWLFAMIESEKPKKKKVPVDKPIT